MTIEDHLEDIRKGIRTDRFNNEASVSQGIVLRLLQALSWSTFDTQIVCPEYSLDGKRVDFALCHPPGKPAAFVEVKQIGQAEGAERQLFEYAFHVGVPLAILTDGQEWNFFLPAEQGNYGERRVYKLDILERDITECKERFMRYLHYDAVISGKAIEAARSDYRNESRNRQMKTALPQAWQKLVEEENELLIELLADRVENLCGYKPDADMVEKFIKDSISLKEIAQGKQTAAPPQKQKIIPTPKKPNSATISGIGFTLNGRFYPAKNGIDALESFLEELTKLDSTFPERFASLPTHGRKRRFLSKRKEDLYPDRPDLARDASLRLRSGHWLIKNISNREKRKIVQMACDVAELDFGKNVVINLGD